MKQIDYPGDFDYGTRYYQVVQRVISKFKSFAEADRADNEYYRSLTPEQRVGILLDLVHRTNAKNGIEPRLERVGRIIQLSED